MYGRLKLSLFIKNASTDFTIHFNKRFENNNFSVQFRL